MKKKKFTPRVTPAEKRFFHEGLKKAHIPFERQKYIKGASGKTYLVDGVVASNIVTSIDGNVHQNPTQAMKDMQRDEDLRKAGWLVIRFENWEIYKQLGKCVGAVKELCKKRDLTS